MKRLALDTARAFSRSFASSVFDRKASLEVDMLRRRNFSKTAAFWAIAVSTLLQASFSRYARLELRRKIQAGLQYGDQVALLQDQQKAEDALPRASLRIEE